MSNKFNVRFVFEAKVKLKLKLIFNFKFKLTFEFWYFISSMTKFICISDEILCFFFTHKCCSVYPTQIDGKDCDCKIGNINEKKKITIVRMKAAHQNSQSETYSTVLLCKLIQLLYQHDSGLVLEKRTKQYSRQTPAIQLSDQLPSTFAIRYIRQAFLV